MEAGISNDRKVFTSNRNHTYVVCRSQMHGARVQKDTIEGPYRKKIRFGPAGSASSLTRNFRDFTASGGVGNQRKKKLGC
jgi:hypothetical protein